MARLASSGNVWSASPETTTSMNDFVGEWVFSDALFDRSPETERDYIRDILIDAQAWPNKEEVGPLSAARIAAILRVKRRVPEFLEACVERVREAHGLTTAVRAHLLADLAVVADAIEGALEAA